MTENAAISHCVPSTIILTGEKQVKTLGTVLATRNLWVCLLVLCDSDVNLLPSLLLNGLLPSDLSLAALGYSLKLAREKSRSNKTSYNFLPGVTPL